MDANGFDNEIAISDICEKALKDIEIFISKNRHILLGTKYENQIENQSPFEFLPGDRVLLLNLSKKYRAFIEEKNKKSERNKLGNKKQKSDDELKSELLEKLMNYARSKKHVIELKKEDISEYEHFDDRIRCRVRCVQVNCEHTTLCNYKSHWNVSNYEMHLLKEHINSTSQMLTNSTGTSLNANSQKQQQSSNNVGSPNESNNVIEIPLQIDLDPELAEIINR